VSVGRSQRDTARRTRFAFQSLRWRLSDGTVGMSSLQLINPHAESIRRAQALMINLSAAKGLQEVLKTNLGG